MNATLNEDTHFAEGAAKHAHKTVGGICTLSLICCRSNADMSPHYSGLQPIQTDGERKDQRRVALPMELLFNLINMLQRRTCDLLSEKPAFFSSADPDMKCKSKRVEGWQVFTHLIKRLKNVTLIFDEC